jgi:membrane dipeptidase
MAKPPTPLIDLHAHLPMQLKLPERPCDTPQQTKRNQRLMNLANRFFNFKNILHPRFRIEEARNQSVCFGSVLYVPSDELFGPCDAFHNLEWQCRKATEKLTAAGYHVARNGADFCDAVGRGKLAAFHCLECGFSIESEARVEQLADLGIAYVVLAHLLFRDISGCVNAFPFFTDAEFERMFPMPDEGLTLRGREICDALCAQGIIPDITHMTRKAADEVFDIALRHERPVIVSHGAPQHGGPEEYKLNLHADVIKAICKSGGVIGVIFYDHWLLPTSSRLNSEGTIDDVVRAMRRIAELTGSTTCIAIGSDFDGFIRPVRGLESVDDIRGLESRLRKEFSDAEVEGILWKNAARTLKAGWK